MISPSSRSFLGFVARGLRAWCARRRGKRTDRYTGRACCTLDRERTRNLSMISPWTRAYAYACARTNASCTHRRPPQWKSADVVARLPGRSWPDSRTRRRQEEVPSCRDDTSWKKSRAIDDARKCARAEWRSLVLDLKKKNRNDELNKTDVLFRVLCTALDCRAKCYFRCFNDFTNLAFARELRFNYHG